MFRDLTFILVLVIFHDSPRVRKWLIVDPYVCIVYRGNICNTRLNVRLIRAELTLVRLGTEWSQSLCVLPLISSSDPCFNLNLCLSATLSVFARLKGRYPTT